MTKKNLIALADAIREHNNTKKSTRFFNEQLESIADALAAMNPQFKRERWLGYIAGTNGSNGGQKEHQTAAQKAEKIALALAYQETLTKQGKPRKTKAQLAEVQ